MFKFILKNKRQEFRKKSKSRMIKKIFMHIGCISIMASIFLLYLGQVNSSASRAYEIQELESEMSAIEAKNESLKLEIAQLKSMEKIEERVLVLNLVKSDEMAYLRENSVVVASR